MVLKDEYLLLQIIKKCSVASIFKDKEITYEFYYETLYKGVL